ncbi:MAG TPA: tetratricopeptide repeat protein, partial [Leptospiraceae bacterium]|nr:tetratricopeptide repeat protein [Leptospiraceae bacterium]
TALSSLANMGEEDTLTNPNVMLARANSFYYTEQLNASLGNYLKIKEDFEEKEAAISLPVPEESNHQEIYQTLIAVYNNIGAIYERKGNTAQALKHYWKSIETARKINTVTEIANYNKDLSFKGTSDKIPLLDDWLSPTVDTIRDLKKSKRKNAWL